MEIYLTVRIPYVVKNLIRSYLVRQTFYFFLFIFIFSCKRNANGTVEKFGKAEIFFSEEGPISSYVGKDKFETKEANRLNSEGVKFAKENDLLKGQNKFLDALKIEPDNPTLLNNIGNIEHELKNYQKAITYYEQSLKKSDSLYLNAGVNLGLLYWKDYEFQKSSQILEYVLHNSTDQYQIGAAHYQLARTYLDNNDCKKSKYSCERAKEIFKDIDGFQQRLKRLQKEINSCVQHNVQ